MSLILLAILLICACARRRQRYLALRARERDKHPARTGGFLRTGGREKGTNADGVNINMNNRAHAGQMIDHIHMHIIPRFKGDDLKLFPHHDLREEEGEPVAEKIRKALA